MSQCFTFKFGIGASSVESLVDGDKNMNRIISFAFYLLLLLRFTIEWQKRIAEICERCTFVHISIGLWLR